jgi:methyl-accepting chemotaxis protein
MRKNLGFDPEACSAALEANHLAGEASSDAESGQSAIHEMVAAMKEINTSSEKISGIIKVIDEIAFQTNLLALNAAVEAAKDTAALIEESVSNSKHGSNLAEKSGEALEKIVSGSKKVADLAGGNLSGLAGAGRGHFSGEYGGHRGGSGDPA